MKTLLAIALLAVIPQDKSEKPEKQESAEELFKRFEKKFEEAKSISVKFKTESVPEEATEPGTVCSGKLRIKNGGRFTLEAEYKEAEGTERKVSAKSDGKKTVVARGTRRIQDETKAGTSKYLVASFTRIGLGEMARQLVENYIQGVEESFSPESLPEPTDFKFGKKEKIGNAEAMTLEYLLIYQEQELRIKLWLDAEKLVPLKRTLSADGQGAGTTTETEIFDELTLDEIPDKEFSIE